MMTIHIQPAEGILAQTFASLPAEGEVTICLAPGVYREKSALRRGNTTLIGAGVESTRITWDEGGFTMLEDGYKRGTFRTATLFLDGDNITLKNLTVENTAAPREEVGQAIALYADGDNITVENCTLLGYQDTLFTAPLPPKEVEPRGFIGPKQFAPRKPQRQYYRHCTIRGDVDFIFGGAAAWFEDCDIVSEDGRTAPHEGTIGFCAAPSTPEGQRYGYVFHKCRFTTTNCPDGSIFLARPWREFAKTVLIDCELGSHICAAGWDDWGKESFYTNGCFAEYGSTGPGAAGKRADFGKVLTAEEAASITEEDFTANALCQADVTKAAVTTLLCQGKTIAACESLTGGLIAATMVEIPGASGAVRGGLVTYQTDTKTILAGVPADIIATYDVVSAPVAQRMAKGARERLGTDIAVSATGLAGPGGGTEEKPVGTVFVGISTPDITYALELHLAGDRKAIRVQTVEKALEAVWRELTERRMEGIIL